MSQQIFQSCNYSFKKYLMILHPLTIFLINKFVTTLGNNYERVNNRLVQKSLTSDFRSNTIDVCSGLVTRVTRRVSLVKQELPTLPDHTSSSPVFSGFRVIRTLFLCVCFVYRCLSFFFW